MSSVVGVLKEAATSTPEMSYLYACVPIHIILQRLRDHHGRRCAAGNPRDCRRQQRRHLQGKCSAATLTDGPILMETTT